MASFPNIAGTIPVVFMKEKNKIVAFSPALDIAAWGKTQAEAKKNFEEALSLFLEELEDKGMVDAASKGLSRKKAALA